MKEISEWLQTIQDPEVREKAIRNREEWIGGLTEDYNDRRASSLKEAIYFSFSWFRAPEGAEYWRDFYDSIPQED